MPLKKFIFSLLAGCRPVIMLIIIIIIIDFTYFYHSSTFVTCETNIIMSFHQCKDNQIFGEYAQAQNPQDFMEIISKSDGAQKLC